MTIPNQVVCPHCGQAYSVRPEQIGQQTQCTRCNQQFTAGAAPPPLPGPLPPGTPLQPNGMATASLILGILFCIPLAGILAVVFGILGLNNTKDPRVGGKGKAIAGIVLGSCGLLFFLPALLISILLPSLNRARETANRIKSASNLRQIGQACLLYENDFQGSYPPDFAILLKTENLSPEVFIAPNSSTSLPSNLPPDQLSNWIDNNSDYTYIGAGYTTSGDPLNVVAFEKDSINHGDGINVLFRDGHVEFDTLAVAHQSIAQTKAKTGQ